MSIEQNKAMAIDFVAGLSAMGYDAAFRNFAADATWRHQPSMPEDGVPVSAAIMKQSIKNFAGTLKAFSLKTVGVTAGGDRGAVEIAGKGIMISGMQYDNTYHFALIFENGEVKQVRECAGTLLIGVILTSAVEKIQK